MTIPAPQSQGSDAATSGGEVAVDRAPLDETNSPTVVAPQQSEAAGPDEDVPQEEDLVAPVVEIATEDETPVAVSQPTIAQEVSLTWGNTSDLLRFVRFTDFVPCDFNADGVIDILALSSRMSTGYGFRGIGNGLFVEGPSFDLPFRPAAAASLGNSNETINGIFLVSASGTVSLFYPLTGEDPSIGIAPNSFSVYRVVTETGSAFAVHGDGEAIVQVFLAIGAGLQDLGVRPVARSVDIQSWYSAVTGWQYQDQDLAFPLPPSGAERTTHIADLNGDGILDLVYYDFGRIFCQLSRDGLPLMAEQSVPCPAKPSSIRTVDVDGNGFPDILAMIAASGTLEVYLMEPTE